MKVVSRANYLHEGEEIKTTTTTNKQLLWAGWGYGERVGSKVVSGGNLLAFWLDLLALRVIFDTTVLLRFVSQHCPSQLP